jgi:uncharacterized protein YbbC (DUF1343 family)
LHRSLALLGLWVWALSCAGGAQRSTTFGSGVGAQLARARPGVDVLLNDSLHLVRNRRVGLVTNQTGVDANGVSDVDRLRTAGVQLVALFSPEHGFRGAADPGAAVASTEDSATGLPIYSLYGRTSAPTDEMLRGIDVILVDLQDAGARYYTYLATTIEVMRAAARNHLPVIVLDRPDPIGGQIQGNVLDPTFTSTVGSLAIPMRHGMTLGELARLAVADLGLTTSLSVVPVSGWRRAQAIDDAGLPFIPPSPNLRSVESLFHYPGLCLFEGTNLSVGRGSSEPFEQIGAPWLDTAALMSRIARLNLPGVRFRSVTFTPEHPGDGKYADTLVRGIRLQVTDRSAYDPTKTAIQLLAIILNQHHDKFSWIPAHFDRLAGTSRLRSELEAGADPAAIIRGWPKELGSFVVRRRAALLYPE